ncbi:low affinity iron permease family protein [Sinorhizobium fredii]|uniref:low affinity iron permease family protein n=1 Tax=Rhizobium fredii TaxID=380 RepID=UPI001294DCED|nr:low affinity iron permease family protein [Sinorhizobium fredii]MQW95583.1 low affinity iron permease family protein [Sinorhizobium fredii]UTY50377.1 low affinity iron permease family protein [Sinorhizobium fredii]
MEPIFTRFSNKISDLAGRPTTFTVALAAIAIWAILGPLFDFSARWQLVVNTCTTIMTFWMVFVLQNSQNRDRIALQAKIDELIRVSDAENRYIGIECELKEVRRNCMQEGADAREAENGVTRTDCKA